MLEQLRELGFRSWALTRVTGGTYAILVTGSGFPAAVGDQLPWTQTLCRVVLEGQAPRIAPDVRTVPGFRTSPLVERWGIGKYVSAPLSVDGSALFGTSCAVDPEPRPCDVMSRLPLVDLQARLLSTVLATCSSTWPDAGAVRDLTGRSTAWR